MIDRPEKFTRLDWQRFGRFLSLGTCAVPKPRRWASRQPRPAPEVKTSWTLFQLALAFTLRALSGGRKGFQF